MKYLAIAAIASAVFLGYVKTAPQYNEATQEGAGWRACIVDEYGAAEWRNCAPDHFKTLAQCVAFNDAEPYGDEAGCFDAIDEARK